MKNKKGFTLVELLAVIVILGLLMAIAIPSVTKYINESKKKTLTKTMSGFVNSVSASVNDSEYVMTDSSAVYAVPIECIEVERGGDNPFGEWDPASSSSWAYVLVQATEDGYNYAFTFKDSAGYGMYPVSADDLDSNVSNIKTDLDLYRPTTGLITTIADFENWEKAGFDIDINTELFVYEASKSGDGKSTCSSKIEAPIEENKEWTGDEEVDNWEDYRPIKCQVLSGSGCGVGDKLRCGDDYFYVTWDNETPGTISVITEWNLDIEANRQSKDNAQNIAFSKDAYWLKDGQVDSKYCSNSTCHRYFVFDENSLLYEPIINYERYLVDRYGLIIKHRDLLTTSRLGYFGCSTASEHCYSADWVVNTNYWVNTAWSNWGYTALWAVHKDRSYTVYKYDNIKRGVRPVYRISLDSINIADENKEVCGIS